MTGFLVADNAAFNDMTFIVGAHLPVADMVDFMVQSVSPNRRVLPVRVMAWKSAPGQLRKW